MFPVGVTRSQGALCTLMVAAVAAPVLLKTNVLLRDGFPLTASPTVY
jgi:hypothetical protein